MIEVADPLASADGDSGEVDDEVVAAGEGDESADAPIIDAVAPPAGRRWARLAGIVSLVYVCGYIGVLVVLESSPTAYNSLYRTMAGTFGRTLLCAFVLALLFHLLDGLRSTIEDLRPDLIPRDVALRAAVRFVTFAVWVPTSVVLLWPSIRGWFAR